VQLRKQEFREHIFFKPALQSRKFFHLVLLYMSLRLKRGMKRGKFIRDYGTWEMHLS